MLVDGLYLGIGTVGKPQDFEAEVWSRFWCWILVNILKHEFDQDLRLEFGQDFVEIL